MDAQPKMPAPERSVRIDSRQWRAVLASVALAAVAYLAFSLWGGWEDVLRAAARVGVSGALALLALSSINYGVRFLRWQLFLSALGRPQPWRPSLQIYLAGFALTTTPGKVGEAVRSLFLKARGVPHSPSMAAFVSERLSDLLAVALLCALGWNIYPPLRPLLVVGIGLIIAALLLITRDRLLNRWAQAMAARSGRWASAAGVMLRLLASARACYQPQVLALATVLSLVAWSAEALAFYLLLQWLGTGLTPAFSFFTYAVGMLAGALSFMPGGLGGTEATMTALLLLGGASQPVAIAATVFIRLTTLWFAVAIGVAALMRLLPSLSRPSTPLPGPNAVEAGRA